MVWKAVEDAACTGIKQVKHQNTASYNLFCFRAGEKPPVQLKSSTGLLVSAHDWQLQADLSRLFKFPERTTSTTLRQSLNIWLVRASSAFRTHFPPGEAQERKDAKHLDLVGLYRGNGCRIPAVSPLRWAAGDSTQASLCTLKNHEENEWSCRQNFQVAVDQRIKINGVDPHGGWSFQVTLSGGGRPETPRWSWVLHWWGVQADLISLRLIFEYVRNATTYKHKPVRFVCSFLLFAYMNFCVCVCVFAQGYLSTN